MFGVETQPQPIAVPDRVENAPHLFEPVTQIAALPGGDLQSNSSPITWASAVRLVDRLCNRRDTGLFARSDVRARVGYQKRHAQLFAPLKFVDVGADRFR